ncbi:MAG: hypothetical protein MMC33_008828 [Icmadophila ericetorum]|nr:hypothetical protein [Icmadophila ericetorum]
MELLNIWGRNKDNPKYDVVGEVDPNEVEAENRSSLDSSKPAGFGSWSSMILHISTFLLGCLFGISVSATILYMLLWSRYGQDYVPYNIARSQKTYMFRPDPLYSAKPSPETNAAWNALQPQGSGFVSIEHPELYGITRPGVPSKHTGQPERFAIAVFHQLHCLTMIREMYYTPPEEKYHSMAIATHAEHCFDYIRQSLQCNADMTLEFTNHERKDGKPFTVDGWGVEHKFCKDWDRIFEWVSGKHRRTGTS